MGASVSKNVTKILINAVATISSKIVQDTNISYDSSQIIYVKDTKGDVIIRGNTMVQHAYINMQALFNAMSSESAQQNLALEIAQSAKSLTSGINIGQYSEAINDEYRTAINELLRGFSLDGSACRGPAKLRTLKTIFETLYEFTK
jgi:hypothetical protein